MTRDNLAIGPAADGPDQPHGLDPDKVGRPLFRAIVRPHCSLSRDGFRIVMALCCLISLTISIAAWRQGFWPIAGFFGLDMLALYIAMSVSFRRRQSFESIVVSPLEVELARVDHRGERREWRFNPLWTRLDKIEDEEFGLRDLILTSRRERVPVARDASPPQRAEIALGMGQALAAAKKGY